MDAVDYKNGQKNQWRRSVWAHVKRHATSRRPVLYLPGSTDLDRDEALRRGFRPADLIAIERDPDVVRHLRSRGVTTISGGLIEVLMSWPVSTPVGALLADMQCGLDLPMLDLAVICAGHPALGESVVVVNLQRGRDKLGKACSPETLQTLDPASAARVPWLRAAPSEKSRAAGFYAVYQTTTHQHLFPVFERLVHRAEQRDAQAIADARRLQKSTVFTTPTFFNPYQSTKNSPWFDSVAFIAAGTLAQRMEALPSGSWVSDGPLASQVAAALAIRTQRLQGKLGGGYRRAA